MSISMESKLIVAPEVLRSTATSFSGKAGDVQSILDEMLRLAAALSNVWEGEAGELYRAKFAKLNNAKETSLKMMNEHVQDLNDMADQYTTAETTAKNVINDMIEPDFD